MVIDNHCNQIYALLAASQCSLDSSKKTTDETIVSCLERKAIPELLGRNFFIPDYQRGYRWEEKQILQLLEDIHKFSQIGFLEVPLNHREMHPFIACNRLL